MSTSCLGETAGGEAIIIICRYPQLRVRRSILRGLHLGKPKVLYFGEILQYLYTSGTKSYGVYNGTLPEKYFYKPSIKLPFAPAWTLDDMVQAAKKQGIKIEYTTVYKNLSVQEKEFRAINSKTPTNVSKASTIPEVKNGRTYAGVKWYPTTIASYNPLPGFNIFGTGLCIVIKNNNDKVINFIKNNGEYYGWSWCSDVPTSDPNFQNILVYYAEKDKPSKYRDRSIQEVDEFKPIKPAKPPAGAPGPGQKQVWVPRNDGANNGYWTTVPDIEPKVDISTNTSVYSGSPWQSGSFGVNLPSGFGATVNGKGLKILVLNGGAGEGAGSKLADVLKKLGFHCARGYQISFTHTRKEQLTYYDETYVPSTDFGELGQFNVADGSLAAGSIVAGWIAIGSTNPVGAPIAGAVTLGLTTYTVAKNPIGTVKAAVSIFNFVRNQFPLVSGKVTSKKEIGYIRMGTEVYRDVNYAIWGDQKTTNFGLNNSAYLNAIVGEKDAEGRNLPVKVRESFNYSAFNRYVPSIPLPIDHSPNNPLITTYYNSVYFRQEISKDTQQKFIYLLKTIERQGSLTQENQIKIDEFTISRSSNSNLYDYMVRGKSETFSLEWAKYCLTNGHWKRINNKRLNRGVYGYVELTPEGKNHFLLGTGSDEIYFDVKAWPKGFPTLDGKAASNWALGMRNITYSEWQDILKNQEKSEYWGLAFILVPVRLTYETLEPADIIIDLRSNWGGITTDSAIINQLSKNPLKPVVVGTSKTVPSTSTTLLPSLPPVPITAPKQGSSTTSTTSTTIPKATTTTTIPKKSTTTTVSPKSTTTTVAPKIVYPDQRDGLSPTTTITRPNVTTITNKVPIIIGDSIAKGLSDRYDSLNSGAETSQVVPNVFLNNPSACEDETLFPGDLNSTFCAWDGYHHKVGDNMYNVERRISNVLRYIDQKDKQLNNRILWLSTGASNNIKKASDVAGALNQAKTQFDQIKVYTDRKKITLVYVMGISKQLNDRYPGTYFNLKLEMLCKKYGFIFVGDFNAPGDGIHPPNYVDIVDGLITQIPTAPITIPPTSSTTPTTIQIGTTTTSLPSSTTTVTKYIPAAPGARPGAGAAGIGAPRPIATTTTSTSTTTPRATTTTTLPAQQSTTTTVTNPNGSITTTTIVFPPKIPVLPPYTPSTSTTVAPDGTQTTTTIVANGVTTTTVVTPSTTTPPANGSPSSTVVTTVPVTTVPAPKKTIPDQRDGVAPAPTTTIPLGPTVIEPKFLSYSVTSLTPENDNKKVNIDVKLTLEFDLSMVRNSGSIFFYKKNTSKALAKIDIFSSEVSFLDSNTIIITPKNVLPYNTDISVMIGAHVLKSTAGKSWAGNAGKWDSITFTTIPDPNTPAPPVAPAPSPTPAPKPKPANPKSVNPKPNPGVVPPKPAPVIPGNPDVTPPNETVQPPTDSVIVINDPVKNEITLQSNDGLWTRNAEFAGTKFKSLKQDLIISQIASNTSWVLEFNISDDAGVVKNIGRIGLERDAPKCVGDIESPAVCFFSMYGGMKSIPELAVDRYRQQTCENKVTDSGPGLSLRNKLIWRNGDSFEFRVSLSESQTQEYNVTYKCLSTERPVTPGFSETIYETDTDKIYMWNGLEWFQIASATLNIAQGAIFENPNTFIINGNWWYGMVWNKTLRRTYPLGKIFVPSDYLNIDATKNYVRYSGPESEKTNVKERKASAKFITPVGFSLDGARGVYTSQ